MYKFNNNTEECRKITSREMTAQSQKSDQITIIAPA